MRIAELIRLGTGNQRTDRHRLAGTVTVDGLPAKRRIIVLDRRDSAFVAGTYSSEVDGAWQISGVKEYPAGQLIVLAYDSTGNYNAEVADYVSQVTW